ncbi:MAG: hypothetical protein L6R37_001220 [Teloschistes peruensis]|nr:MAG: hypothetical protein L6R37_001220 [Teloschistes peruensis]
MEHGNVTDRQKDTVVAFATNNALWNDRGMSSKDPGLLPAQLAACIRLALCGPGKQLEDPLAMDLYFLGEEMNEIFIEEDQQYTVQGKPEFPKLSSDEIKAVISSKLDEARQSIKEPTYDQFVNDITRALETNHASSDQIGRIVESLREIVVEQKAVGLTAQIKYAYYSHLAAQSSTKSSLEDQAKLTDLRYPVEWYPEARHLQRTIHLHVGPTNSGKTYHALKRLEQAVSGVYAGPLRLLAHEVYTRLNARGKSCHLVTGDERRMAEDEDAKMLSCTVEMVPINIDCDVAVIDEIQMLGHEERGWAWTQALLGLRAKELHLCGEERTVPLIRELAAAMGDNLEVHHYQRLSPLKTMQKSLMGNLGSLRKGDCVVAFSKLDIHRLKRVIEDKTRKNVAIVYGNLPPEIRAQQAALFNDVNNDYDFLVASDAIGMGLNLSIKRIVFGATTKFNGFTKVPIEGSQIKQIAGRAGRFRTAAQATEKEPSVDRQARLENQGSAVTPEVSPAQNLGLVTTLWPSDLPWVQTAMASQADPIMTAGIFPPTDIIVRFSAYFPPSTPLSYILLRLHKISVMHPRFHMCVLKDQLGIADTIEPVKNLTIADRLLFCAAPASMKEDAMRPVVRAFAECVGNGAAGGILDIPVLNLRHLDKQVPGPSVDRIEFLGKLEFLHRAIVLYLWLSYRFAGVFNTQAMAFYVKSIVEERIQRMLTMVSSRQGQGTIVRGRTTKFWKPRDGFDLTQNLDFEDADNEGSSESNDTIAARAHTRDGANRQVYGATVKTKTLPQPGDEIDPSIIVASSEREPQRAEATA